MDPLSRLSPLNTYNHSPLKPFNKENNNYILIHPFYGSLFGLPDENLQSRALLPKEHFSVLIL